MRRFLLQMAGESGTGKSTLARAVGCETGAVVIDKDVIKSRLLEGDLGRPRAGPDLEYPLEAMVETISLGLWIDLECIKEVQVRGHFQLRPDECLRFREDNPKWFRGHLKKVKQRIEIFLPVNSGLPEDVL